MAKYIDSDQKPIRRAPPATTPEGRENQLISMAMDLAEKRMLAGTASAQETTHFLKLGSRSALIERQILEQQKEFLAAKTEAIRSAKRVDELYSKAIVAMRKYRGDDEPEEDDERED